MNIFLSIPLLFFWSAVFSFVPSAIYLIMNPLESIRAEELFLKDIFVIKKAVQFEKEKRKRSKGIGVIYGLCFVFMVFLSVVNWNRLGHAAVIPIDILSTTSVVLFCFAALTYFPVVLYLIFKAPWRYKEEGVYLRKAFVAYGISIFLFSMFYAYRWLTHKGFSAGGWDLVSSLFICVLSAAAISYIPILAYIMVKSRKRRIRGIRPGVIFVIFSLSFLIFSGLYIQDWIYDRKSGVKRVPLTWYLEFS